MGILYSKTKIFHYKDKIDSLPRDVEQILPPIHIRIKPTNVCSHGCWYCAYKADDLQLGKDMVKLNSIPREKMLEIIEDLIELKVQSVTFSGGGEPFQYHHFVETLQKLAQSPIKFASLTNGSKMEGEAAEIFAHHGTWVRVSMDGWDDESYVEYRKVRMGEYTKIMNNMKKFISYGGKCFLSVSINVDQKNANHVYESLSKLKDIGVKSVKVSPTITSNDGVESNNYHKPVYQLVRDQVDKAKASLQDSSFEIFDAYHELDKKFTKDYDWCPYLQILHVIGADMNIYPCQDKAYNLEEGLIGSIKEQRYRDFWMNNKEKFFKINPSKVCNHHCVANEKNKLVLEYLNLDKDHVSFV